MIFKGVTVEMVYEDAEVHYSDSGVPVRVDGIEDRTRMQGEPSKIFEILVTVPDLDAMELAITLSTGGGYKRFDMFDLFYKKLPGDAEFEPFFLPGKNTVEASDVVKFNEGYKVRVSKCVREEILENLVRLETVFYDKSGLSKFEGGRAMIQVSDEFVVRIRK